MNRYLPALFALSALFVSVMALSNVCPELLAPADMRIVKLTGLVLCGIAFILATASLISIVRK